jgi:phosphorylcholine metabolism protein LicD
MSIAFLCTIVASYIVLINGAVLTNDVTVKVDKDYYKFQKVTCQINGLSKHNDSVHSFNNTINQYDNSLSWFLQELYFKKRANIKIVTSSQLQSGGTIDELTDVSADQYIFFSNISSNKDNVNVTLNIDPKIIFGPKFYGRIDFDNYGRESDNGYTKLGNPANTSWIPAGPYRCIVINNDKTKILGASQPFTVGGPPDPVIIKVLKTSYIPGQVFRAEVYNQNLTLFDEPIRGDYLRVYKVPYDVSNNLTALNTVGGSAKFISPLYFEYLQYPHYRTNYSAIEQDVRWKEPGKYQIVMLSDYNQIFRGISNVFEVAAITRTKNTTVTLSSNATFPGQNFNVTIYKPDPPFGARIGIAYMSASDKVISYVNGTKKWVSYQYWSPDSWNSTTTSLTVNTAFNEWRHGWYKVVVLAGDIVIGVSKQLLVKRPNIQIPLPKRTYSQWESMPTTIIQPYSVGNYDFYYAYEIIPTHISDSYYSTGGFPSQMDGPNRYGYPIELNTTVVKFTPGLYNIRLVVHKNWWKDNHQYFQLDYVSSIRNTTFKVVKNTLQIMIAKNQTKFKYGDILNYSVTSTNKVPLDGPIPIYSTGKDWSPPIASLQRSDENNNSTGNAATLYGSIKIETYNFGCPLGRSPYDVQLHTSESTYNTNDFENVYSSILSIDDKSKPNNQCN